MKADPGGVLTGTPLIDGDRACGGSCVGGGCTVCRGLSEPAVDRSHSCFLARVPTVGGTFIQMEDELAAPITLQGRVWAREGRSQ